MRTLLPAAQGVCARDACTAGVTGACSVDSDCDQRLGVASQRPGSYDGGAQTWVGMLERDADLACRTFVR